MTNILPFKPSGKKKKAPKGNIMCKNNHHKWQVQKAQRFDVKSGKLVTVEKCSRCEKVRNRLT